MWEHNYDPFGNPVISTLVAAVPIVVLLIMIGVLRKPAWMSALAGLGTALVVAIVAYGMPPGLAVSSSLMGAAFGLLPIGWIVYWAVVLYRITLETGNFEIIKDSIGGLTADRRLQAMLIAFAFPSAPWGPPALRTPGSVTRAGTVCCPKGLRPRRP
jgi:lactate permease